MNFKMGDKVRILRKARTHERGWQNSWIDEMSEFVGKIGRVVFVSKEFRHDVEVRVQGDVWGYPDFVLQKIESAKRRKKAA